VSDEIKIYPPTASAAEALGLKAGDRFQVAMNAGPWVVVRRLPEGVEPENAKLVIAGSLVDLSVPEALQLAQSSNKDGELAFTLHDGVKKILFRRGDIVYATSTLGDDRLGAFLVGKGRIDKRTFGEVQLLCDREKKKFGRVLVEKNVLTSRELYEAVRDQVEAILMSLFAYSEGSFAFVAREIPAADNFRLPRPTSFYLMEGVRTSDELAEHMKRAQARENVFRKTAKAAAFSRPGMERDVLALIDGIATVKDVLAQSTWSEANTVQAIAKLLQEGAVEKCDPAMLADLPMEAIGELSGPEELILKVSTFLMEVRIALGADSAQLDGYFDSVPSTYEEVFGGDRLQPDGALPATAIAKFVNTHTAELGPEFRQQAMEMVTEALGDVIEYAVWVASEHLPAHAALRIAEAAAQVKGET
jgi:hypothetical protein